MCINMDAIHFVIPIIAEVFCVIITSAIGTTEHVKRLMGTIILANIIQYMTACQILHHAENTTDHELDETYDLRLILNIFVSQT